MCFRVLLYFANVVYIFKISYLMRSGIGRNIVAMQGIPRTRQGRK
nr:MAG TPA: hypothetical protein [Caudoviricetes sp.]